MTAAHAKKELHCYADKVRAQHAQDYFKTGKGEYGEGDRFIGARVPEVRRVAKKFSDLPLTDIQSLLQSPIHEERLLALIILVNQFRRAHKHHNPALQQTIYQCYIKHFDYINNWDLVDSSASHIVGGYLFSQPAAQHKRLTDWAQSDHLWTRRIAIMASAYFIAQDQYSLTLKLAKQCLNDPHDLIHKASGWMLREVGKRDKNQLLDFLNQHFTIMPRTMLRYAIEKLSDTERAFYLRKKFTP